MKVSSRQFLVLILVSTLLAGCSVFSSKNTDKAQTTETAPETAQPVAETQHHKNHTTNQHSNSNYNNIWDRVRDGYGLPSVSDSQLSSNLRWFSSKQSYFNRFTDQAEPYLYYVVSEMEANDIPLELALIPVLESSYDPNIKSPSNTAGIWQFVPETGRNFGLKQNSWYNGRKDVIASTDAAIRYIKKLNSDVNGDWLLTIAAYNAGEGTVNNAIEKNKRAGKPTDFWSLPLPKHTKEYIPQLIALSKVIANPQRYNISLKAIPDTPYFVKVNVDKQINLAQAAKQANIDPNELKKLNAGMNGWLTSPLGGHQLLVPVENAAEFTLQLDSLPKPAKIQWQEHVAKKGETVASVAKLYGVDAGTISSINNLQKTQLQAGQRLQIPLSPTSISPEATSSESTKVVADNKSSNKRDKQNKNAKQEQPAKEARTYYTVKSGENLWTIAKAQKISVNTLAKINDLSLNSTLKPGQKLLLLSQATP